MVALALALALALVLVLALHNSTLLTHWLLTVAIQVQLEDRGLERADVSR